MRSTLPECGLAEAMLAARAAGPLTSENQRQLDEHLEVCTACTQLARELETPLVAEALVDDAREDNFDDASDRTEAETRLRHLRSRLELAIARWPHVVELQGQLALAAVQLAENDADPTEARSLRAQALQVLEPLQQRGALGLAFRGLPERARRAGVLGQ